MEARAVRWSNVTLGCLMYPSENSWKLVEALRREGHHIIIRAVPDEVDTETDDGRYGVTLRGYPTFTGATLDEAIRRLATSRCWESTPTEGREENLRRVKVTDIIDKVKELASQYTTPFRADELSVEMGVYPAAVGHALKKLNWPKSQRQATATVNGREVSVYVYLPVIR